MTTLLLFSLPWGYLIAALFLLIAIILFIIAIFMKDTGTNEEGELEDDRYGQQEEAYETASYEDTFDRYQNVTDVDDTEDTLQDMIIETSDDLAETRMFTPVVDIPEPEPYEETVEPEEIKEEVPEEVYEAPVSGFGAFAEPEELPEDTDVDDEDADVKIVEEVPEKPMTEEVATEEEAAPEEIYEAPEEDEFEEVVPPKKSLFNRSAVAGAEDDVPKPVAKQKSGMSFAEEVRRLIEEEERRNKNS